MIEVKDLSLVVGNIIAAIYADPAVCDDTKQKLKDISVGLLQLVERIEREEALIANVTDPGRN